MSKVIKLPDGGFELWHDEDRVVPLSEAQMGALGDLYRRQDARKTFREFLRGVTPLLCGGGCVLVDFAGMVVGVERDGTAHS